MTLATEIASLRSKITAESSVTLPPPSDPVVPPLPTWSWGAETIVSP